MKSIVVLFLYISCASCADSVLVGQITYHDIAGAVQGDKDQSYCVIDSGQRHHSNLIILKSKTVDLKSLSGKYCRLEGEVEVYDHGIKVFSVNRSLIIDNEFFIEGTIFNQKSTEPSMANVEYHVATVDGNTIPVVFGSKEMVIPKGNARFYGRYQAAGHKNLMRNFLITKIVQ